MVWNERQWAMRQAYRDERERDRASHRIRGSEKSEDERPRELREHDDKYSCEASSSAGSLRLGTESTARANTSQQSSPTPQQQRRADKSEALPSSLQTLFAHEDSLRETFKARLQQMGDVVNVSTMALNGKGHGKLAESCRSVVIEVSSFGKQLMSQQAELNAEIDEARRRRILYGGAPGRMPPDRVTAMTSENDLLRDEIKALKVRERQLLSQVRVLGSSSPGRRSFGASDSLPGMQPDTRVADEIMRLNEEVSALRGERDMWRARALSAEGKLAMAPLESSPEERRASGAGLAGGLRNSGDGSGGTAQGMEAEERARRGEMMGGGLQVHEGGSDVGGREWRGQRLERVGGEGEQTVASNTISLRFFLALP
jgi:hypothetical protein